MDGTERAAAFAYYAFFSLFPVMLLFVAVASWIADPQSARETLVTTLRLYLPGSMSLDGMVLNTLDGVLASKGKIGFVALLVLIWSGAQFFMTMVKSADRAFGVEKRHNWWQMPAKSILLLGVTGLVVLTSLVLSVAVGALRNARFLAFLPPELLMGLRFVMPSLVLFFGLILFYKIAPKRKIPLSQVWFAAFATALTLTLAEGLFTFYLTHIALLNAVYGAIGGMIAFLLWIFLSGCIFIFGACLAAEGERAKPRTPDD